MQECVDAIRKDSNTVMRLDKKDYEKQKDIYTLVEREGFVKEAIVEAPKVVPKTTKKPQSGSDTTIKKV
jgi:hypothetical protein